MENPTTTRRQTARASGRLRAAPRLSLLLAILAFAPPLQIGSASEPAPESAEPVLVVSDDPAAIFQKAFWRRPHPDDRIVHAERREWLDTDGGVVRWQWFLIVEPSQPTLDWLAGNPFLLSPAATALKPAAPPDWFPAEFAPGAALGDATGRHVLALAPDGARLFATDSGDGFAR